MNKQVIYLFIVLLLGYLSIAFCEESETNTKDIEPDTNTDLLDEGRRRHGLHGLHGYRKTHLIYCQK